MFRREVSDEIISSLQEERLFKEKILPDINSNKIFCAIRNNKIDFYHKGGRLFSYTNTKELLTHVKYAAVIKSKRNKNYVTQKQLKETKLIDDFVEGYDRIKENCSKYSGVEADGVSCLYHKFPYTSVASDVVVLDIEISLKTGKKQEDYESDTTQNRIDILMYHKKEKKLRFYEAKHFSNKELWAEDGVEPQVIDQISRYEYELDSQKEEIFDQYKKYVDIVNKIYDRRIPSPQILEPKVGLLVFGYNRDQWNRKLKNHLSKNGSLGKIYCYPIGNVSNIIAENMWNETKCG